MEILIPTPPDFNYQRTVLSHGWCTLLPFTFDQTTWTLERVLYLPGAFIMVTITSDRSSHLIVRTSRKPGAQAQASVIRDIRHIFRLDDEMTEFYAVVNAHADFSWIAQQGAGRLLRSPTVYEDLVKSLCTTNCSWAMTEKMVTALVHHLGREAKNGKRSFPTPEAMSEAPLKFYSDVVRAGYRAPYLKELAGRVKSGEINPEQWLHSDLPTAELKREIKNIKGVGDYAAENLLKLIGRYDVLALDSWVRARYAQLRNRGRTAPDEKIGRTYSRFKSWRGLAIWCDVTRDWIAEASVTTKTSE